jgi:cysteine desulfurase
MFKVLQKKQRIYLDHAATTYLDESVIKAMKPFWMEKYGNPSSLYFDGAQALKAIDNARQSISKNLNCKAAEIVFTAGGTESVNLAIFGVARKHLSNKKLPKPHLICSSIEHHAVLESFKALEEEGVEVTYLPVDSFGFVNTKELTSAIRSNTILVSIILANNEIGTIQSISELSKTVKAVNPEIIFHTDACQAAGVLSLEVNKLGIDLMSLNASKIYGPKQIGLLYVRSGVNLKAIIYGGGQERALRSGTENVPAIVGFAKALEIAQKHRQKESKRLRNLRDYFIKNAFQKIPDLILNGPNPKNDSDKNQIRLPNNINFSVIGAEGEALMFYLDAQGVEISTGSACTSMALNPSHVIKAIGKNDSDAKSAIRISLGKNTTKKDLDFVLKIMPPLVNNLRKV